MRNIRDLTDLSLLPTGKTGTMVIKISVDERQPPIGNLTWCPGQSPVPFAGWMNLLAILAEVIDEPPASMDVEGAPQG